MHGSRCIARREVQNTEADEEVENGSILYVEGDEFCSPFAKLKAVMKQRPPTAA